MFKNFFVAVALLFIFFAPSGCEDKGNRSDSIAQAIVYHLEKR
jgi:hypothetical protein